MKGAQQIIADQPKKIKKEMEMIHSLQELKSFLKNMKDKL